MFKALKSLFGMRSMLASNCAGPKWVDVDPTSPKAITLPFMSANVLIGESLVTTNCVK